MRVAIVVGLGAQPVHVAALGQQLSQPHRGVPVTGVSGLTVKRDGVAVQQAVPGAAGEPGDVGGVMEVGQDGVPGAPDETLIDVIGRWLRNDDRRADEDIRRLARRMFEANPELHALRIARMTTAIREGAEAIARDTGTALGAAGPRIAAVATAAILIELADVSAGPEGEQAIATALRFLKAGIDTL